MAFNRPTLDELVDRIKTDMSSRLLDGGSILRRSFVYVLARVLAGAAHLLYGYLDWIAKQIMPDTAESTQLRRWAAIWGVKPKSATFAQGNVSFTGANGAVIPAGTELQRQDGVIYTTDDSATIGSGVATVAVTCATAGESGDTDAGAQFSLVSPIAGVSSTCTVATGGLIDGQDAETDDALRARLLDRIQEPPNGGAENDYVQWALEVAGVTRAWVYPAYLGLGTVGVSFVLDDANPIIPDSTKVAEVQAYIDDPSRKPVTADVTVFAPIASALNFTIDPTPDTAAVRAAIEAELRDLIRREAEPGGTLLISHIREAISKAAGETDHTLTLPASDVTTTAGHITTMGVITWV